MGYGVLIAAIGSFVLGMLWYSPALFGNQWMKMSGIKKKDSESKNMGLILGSGFLLGLLTAYVMSVVNGFYGASAFVGGATLGAWIWLGFQGPMTAGGMLWGKDSLNLWLLNNAFALLNLALMGGIIAIWA